MRVQRFATTEVESRRPTTSIIRAVRSLRAVVATCVASATVVVVPGLGAAASEAAAPRCRLAHLRVVFARVEGAAGTIHNEFNVVNRGDRCHVRGYFGIGLLNRSGDALRTRTHRAGRSPTAAAHQSRTVVLRRDQRAHFTVSYSDVCRRRQLVKASKLRLTPPRASNSVVVPAHPRGEEVDFAPCHGRLDVYRIFKRKAS